MEGVFTARNSLESTDSPVADLTHTLCNLTTKSCLSTPKRFQLSETSSPYVLPPVFQEHEIHSGSLDSPLTCDSPTITEGVLNRDFRSGVHFLRRVKNGCVSRLRHSQLAQSSQDKENIPSNSTPMEGSPKAFTGRKSSGCNDGSQDSGYMSSQSEKEEGGNLKMFATPLAPPQYLRTESSDPLYSDQMTMSSTSSGYATPESFRKSLRSLSSISMSSNVEFGEESNDDFMSSFSSMPMEESDQENALTDRNFADLMTAPLSLSHYHMDENQSPLKDDWKPSGSRIRRCLSMSMDDEEEKQLPQQDSSSSSSAAPERNVAFPLKPLGQNRQANSVTVFQSCSPSLMRASDHSETKVNFKRPEPPTGLENVTQVKRPRSASAYNESISILQQHPSPDCQIPRCYSETHKSIMMALQKSDQNPNLVGDFSRSYSLPLVKGQHQDLKAISSDTLKQVLDGEFDNVVNKYTIVDCRYPYEYLGGHIQGAKNIYTEEGIKQEFIMGRDKPEPSSDIHVVIFHCEFSSERGPKMCRYLRKIDREKNKDYYPLLHYPEVYLLHGGYKSFFETHKDFCTPKKYTPMNHKDHGEELRNFRSKSKSWGTDAKGARVTVRPGLKF